MTAPNFTYLQGKSMPLRFAAVVICCFALLLASTVHAGQWDFDDYYPSTVYPEGRGTTLGIATFYGFAFGWIASGLILIFYWNPDADKNFDTVMIATVPTCTLGGLIIGMTLPPDAYNVAAANLTLADNTDFNWSMPRVSSKIFDTPEGDEQVWYANLLRMSF